MTERNRCALIIGNSQYRDETLRQLVTPELDAQALADVLEDPDIGDFEVKTLLDQESQTLREAIEEFFLDSKHDDILLLYYSGHGVRDDFSGELHLATVNTKRERLNSTSVPAGFVRRMVGRSPANCKILVLDSCYSGAFTSDMLTKGDPGVAAGQQFGAEARGTVILTASTALQYAFEGMTVKELSKGAQSFFTRFLVQGLGTGEAGQEDTPFITINDLFYYVVDQMRQEGSKQTPEMTGIGQQGNIVIAKSVRPREATLPEGVLQLLMSPLRGNLLMAIDDLGQLAKGEDNDLVNLAIEELGKLSLLEGDIVVQNAAKAALAELERKPPEAPIICFSSGEQPGSVAEWVSLVDRKWGEATECLYGGKLENWLTHINQDRLAGTAAEIRQTEGDRSIGLERFQRVTGLVKRQTKQDVITNMDEIIGQLNYLALRKQKSRRSFTLRISHTGRGYLHGTVISNVGWLEVPKPSFGCLPGQSATVEIVFVREKFKMWRPLLRMPLDLSIE
jgi:uncharacterized caspase-like protein